MTLVEWITTYIFDGVSSGNELYISFTACLVAVLAFGFALKTLYNVFKIFIH